MRVSPGQAIVQMAQSQAPARLSAQDRAHIYQHVFGTPGGAGETKPNRDFQDLWVRFLASVAQFGRQGAQSPTARALSVESIRTAARDLATRLTPLVESALAGRDMWQVIDQVGTLELGGAANTTRVRTLAETGGAIIEYLAGHPEAADSAGGVDDWLRDTAEQWLAVACSRVDDAPALSQHDAARRVAAWSQSLFQAVGLGDAGDKPGLRAATTTAVFSGPAGTGKTLAAQWLATALGRDVYRIDLTQVVSKYIGETEKNLDAIFRHAEQSDSVLLFDEADALFGKRSEIKDAHDRYANQEVSTLLDRMEGFAGVALLVTNHKDALDPAFLRRMKATVEFPLPPRPQPPINEMLVRAKV